MSCLKTMRDAILATAGVNEALYRQRNRADGGKTNTVNKVHPDWSTGKRTGDIVATSDSGVAFSEPDLSGNPLPGNHGAPQTEDNFMAVIGGWPSDQDGHRRRRRRRRRSSATTTSPRP